METCWFAFIHIQSFTCMHRLLNLNVPRLVFYYYFYENLFIVNYKKASKFCFIDVVPFYGNHARSITNSARSCGVITGFQSWYSSTDDAASVSILCVSNATTISLCVGHVYKYNTLLSFCLLSNSIHPLVIDFCLIANSIISGPYARPQVPNLMLAPR